MPVAALDIDRDLDRWLQIFAYDNVEYSRLLRLAQDHERGERCILIISDKKKISGYISIVWRSEHPILKEQNWPELVDLFIDKNYRRQGLGQQLIMSALQEIELKTSQKCTGIFVSPDNMKAQRLYKKCGFRGNRDISASIYHDVLYVYKR